METVTGKLKSDRELPDGLKISTLLGLGLVSLVVVFLVAWVAMPPLVPLFYGFPGDQRQLTGRFWLALPHALYLLLTLFVWQLVPSKNPRYLFFLARSSLLLIWCLLTLTLVRIFFLVGYPLNQWSWK